MSGEIDSLKSTVKIIRLTFQDSPPERIEAEGLLRTQHNGRDCFVTLTGFNEDKLGQLRQRYSPISSEVRSLTLDEIFEEFVLSQ